MAKAPKPTPAEKKAEAKRVKAVQKAETKENVKAAKWHQGPGQAVAGREIHPSHVRKTNPNGVW